MQDTLSAEQIETLATSHGLSVLDLCRRAQVAHTSFYRWRAGQSQPTLEVYRRLITALREAEAA